MESFQPTSMHYDSEIKKKKKKKNCNVSHNCTVKCKELPDTYLDSATIHRILSVPKPYFRPQLGLVASVTWRKNCSTTLYASVLQGADMITFLQ